MRAEGQGPESWGFPGEEPHSRATHQLPGSVTETRPSTKTHGGRSVRSCAQNGPPCGLLRLHPGWPRP
ncbi:unnamed protein product [Rangifer tarandus platyrhynchus]|uniref:Uncharacterized protein n=1 Tax=Rangifer tarandus platyrhynchus TaxID=3082113 RepID=A0ABN8ZZT2_RANTA|nr:unnamed protein product [Rangifer tarandus platyrhynchus]